MSTATSSARLQARLVPDALWEIVAATLPTGPRRPQGGGRARVADRAVFTAVVLVLTSGVPWRALPACLGVAAVTAFRRYTEWTQAGVFAALPGLARDWLTDTALIEWVDAIAAAAEERNLR